MMTGVTVTWKAEYILSPFQRFVTFTKGFSQHENP